MRKNPNLSKVEFLPSIGTYQLDVHASEGGSGQGKGSQTDGSRLGELLRGHGLGLDGRARRNGGPDGRLDHGNGLHRDF